MSVWLEIHSLMQPEVTANIGFEWEMAQVANGVVMLAADAAFSDQYHFDTFGDYSYKQR